MTASLTWDLAALRRVIGEVPEGDAPAAWWLSLHPDVFTAYEVYRVERQVWADRFTTLAVKSGLSQAQPMCVGVDGGELRGLILPDGWKVPQWWRVDKQGLFVPRRRTKAEKEGLVLQEFLNLNRVPVPAEYLPGMPNTLWGADKMAYPVHIRRSPRPGSAVLAFVGSDPEKATPVFAPDEHWTKMNLSTFYTLREAQTGQPPQLMPMHKPGIMR